MIDVIYRLILESVKSVTAGNRPVFNSGIDLELDLIPSLIPEIGMVINF